MEDRIFDSAGDCHPENFPNHVKADFDFPELFKINPAVDFRAGTGKKINHDQGGDDSAGKGCDSGSCHADFCPVNQKRVSGDVGEIHHQAHFEGDFAVTHGAEKSRAGIVNGKKRKRKQNPDKINQGVPHHALVDFAVNEIEDKMTQGQTKRDNHQGDKSRDNKKLTGSRTGFLISLMTKVLAGNNSATRGKGRKELDEKLGQLVDERHSRNAGLAHRRDHHGVTGTNGHGKKLLRDKRKNEAAKVLFCEKIL